MDWEHDGITRRSALYYCVGGLALVCSFDLNFHYLLVNDGSS